MLNKEKLLAIDTSGYTADQLCRMFDVKKTTLLMALKRNNLSYRKKYPFKLTDEHREKIKKYDGKNLTGYEIAKMLNINKAIVYNYLKEKPIAKKPDNKIFDWKDYPFGIY